MTDLDTTQQLTRGEAADYLREFADQLDDRPTDPLTAGLYESDGEPTDASSTGAATDTSTRGRTTTPANEASTHDASTHPTGSTGTGAGTGAETDTGAGVETVRETDSGTDAAARTGDDPSGPSAVRDGRVTILAGNDSATVNPPSEVTLAVAVGTDDSFVTSDTEQFVSFELTWDADAVEDEDTLDIE